MKNKYSNRIVGPYIYIFLAMVTSCFIPEITLCWFGLINFSVYAIVSVIDESAQMICERLDEGKFGP